MTVGAAESGAPSFESVTETPGVGATREQLSRMLTRYEFAARLAAGKDVLEVACGSGIGLGLLASRAKRVVGGDIDPAVLAYAREHYASRPNVELRELDAQALPFADATFDVVLLFEAIYYLPDVERFVAETRRVLRPGGTLLIVSANPEWTEFNPSPFSTRYPTAAEHRALLERHGFATELRGAFRTEHSALSAVVNAIKRIAVRFHLMPKTMKGKQLLKRIFMGELQPLPREIAAADGSYVEPEALVESQIPDTKVIYAIGRRE